MAYIVCDALGLDTGDYSFAYVARWSDGFTELVKDTAERVVRCAQGDPGEPGPGVGCRLFAPDSSGQPGWADRFLEH